MTRLVVIIDITRNSDIVSAPEHCTTRHGTVPQYLDRQAPSPNLTRRSTPNQFPSPVACTGISAALGSKHPEPDQTTEVACTAIPYQLHYRSRQYATAKSIKRASVANCQGLSLLPGIEAKV